MARQQDQDAANWLWLRGWTKTVDVKLNLILLAMKQVKENGQISSDLEEEINETLVRSKSIDRKVPDNQ